MSAIKRGDEDNDQTQERIMEVLEPHGNAETAKSFDSGQLKGMDDSELSSTGIKTGFERYDDESFDVEHKDTRFRHPREIGNQSHSAGGANSLHLNLDSGFFSSSTPVLHCSTTRDNLSPKPVRLIRLTENVLLSEKAARSIAHKEDAAVSEDLFKTCLENQDFDSTCNSELFLTPSKEKESKNEIEIPECAAILTENKGTVELTGSISALPDCVCSTIDSACSEETSKELRESQSICSELDDVEHEPTSTEIIIDGSFLTLAEGFDETDQLIDESPILSVEELILKFESLHIFSQYFRERKFLERSLSCLQEEASAADIQESYEESSSVGLLNKPLSALASVHNQPEDEAGCCDLGLRLGSSLRSSLTISKSDLSLNNTPLIEEVTEIRSARLTRIEDDSTSYNSRNDKSFTALPRLSAPIMDEMAVNGDVGTLHVNNNEGPPVLNDVITSNGVEISSNGANTAGALRNTVHMISMDNNTKVYIVGTAHFSEESNEEVRQVIRRVRPSDVVVELCPARKDILLRNFNERVHSTPNALSYQNIQAMIKQHKSTMVGIFYSLMLHVSVKVQKSTGLVAGGEFRAAYEECESVDPMPKVHLGDRNVLVTLQRAWYSLSVWKQISLIFTLLWSDIDITNLVRVVQCKIHSGARQRNPHTLIPKLAQEEIENCKEKDVLEMLLNELRQDFPELCNVILSERDLYLASSIRRVANKCAPNSAIVAVVGIGHMKGIVKNWESAQDADLQELCRIPRKQSRIPWKLLFRLSILSGAAFFAYRYCRR